jgi:hypothetical protein
MASTESEMIDLGRNPSSELTSPAKKSSVYYPSLSLSTEEPIDFPDGQFTADVMLKLKSSSNSTDENGKKRYSYTLDVCGLDPDFAEEDAEESEEGEAEEPDEQDDAATAILKSMGAARQQKMADMEEPDESA